MKTRVLLATLIMLCLGASVWATSPSDVDPTYPQLWDGEIILNDDTGYIEIEGDYIILETASSAPSRCLVNHGPNQGQCTWENGEWVSHPAPPSVTDLQERIETLEQQVLELQERVCTLEEDERKEWELLWEPIELGEGDIDLTGQGYPPLYTPTITVE